MLANSRRFELNDGLLAQLHQHAHNLNCTPFVLLLAAYMITISCLSSRLTVCVATPVANRNHEQVQTLVGSFINTIMVLVDIHPTNTISQTIANVRSTLLDALQHQHVPYDLLVERLSSSSRNRHTGHPQLFQTMFLMQNDQELPMMNGITSVNVIDAPMKYAKCELTWMLAERGADLVVDIEYNATLFHADTIDRIMTIYRRILFEIVTDDGSKQIHQLSLVNDIESHQLMQVYATRAITDTPDSYPIGVIIHQQSLLLPHAIFTVSIDYQHLIILANIIGRRLQQQMIQNSCSSIRADDIVAICCINESNAYVCIVIALTIGCGYVPCDRQWPNARLRHIIHETNSRMLLTDYDIDDECIMVVNVVQEMSTFDKHNNCRSVRSIDMSTSLAYIIYTSGKYCLN
jgi:non-ribosomal peptide synthetase component F